MGRSTLFSLAKFEPLKLAGRGAGQIGANFDPPRVFPGAGELLDVDAQAFEQVAIRIMTCTEHDEGFGFDQPIGVPLGDYCRVDHRRM